MVNFIFFIVKMAISMPNGSFHLFISKYLFLVNIDLIILYTTCLSICIGYIKSLKVKFILRCKEVNSVYPKMF